MLRGWTGWQWVVAVAAAVVNSGKATTGGVLSLPAVGCPVCNKAVVLAVGVSGALSYWAPFQPFLAVVSLALLGFALRQRLRGMKSCPIR